LSYHGLRKKSLSLSGASAAFFVGFTAFATSYRFGIMLILFYYTGSKLTKVKEDVKAKLEEDFKTGGQRNYTQVLANSILASTIAILFYVYEGEDRHLNFDISGATNFSSENRAAYLWCLYVAHYACAAADTWASEIGILAKQQPILITTFRRVPSGTNGGISALGTLASAAGGAFIGLVFYLPGLLFSSSPAVPQYPMVIFGLICGLVGSLLDSLLGATLQATFYSKDRKMIVKHPRNVDKSIEHISGIDILSNEAVNFFSILLTMLVVTPCAPYLFQSFV
jgi:uncharacterized membrane protein